MPEEMGEEVNPSRIQACQVVIRAIMANPDMDERPRKEVLLTRLTEMFPGEPFQSKITALAAGAESVLDTIPTGLSSSVTGFADSLLGTVVVEFKSDLNDRAKLDDAVTKLKRYTASLWTQNGPGTVFCCVASDVLSWKVWAPIPNYNPPNGEYDATMVHLLEREMYEASNDDEEAAKGLILFLKRFLFDETLLTISGVSLRREFGLNSIFYQRMSQQLNQLLLSANESTEVDLAKSKWKEYQTYNARDVEFPDLYIKHLYLVLLSRLIVAAGMERARGRPIDDGFVRSILTGEYFAREGNLRNIVEQDFFHWVVRDPWIASLLPLSKQMFHSLRSYDFSRASRENVLRLIFEEMMPPERADVFGQRSTPEILASDIVSYLFDGTQDAPRFLDPSCGSGTFVHAAIMEMRQRMATEGVDEREQLRKIVSSIVGIDIDPIAVIASKAIWALAVSDLLAYSEGPIHIPIYNADSLFVPEISNGRGAATISIQFDSTQISVPSEVIKDAALFDRVVNWSYIKAKELAERARISSSLLASTSPEAIKGNLQSICDGNLTELTGKDDLLAKALSDLVNELAKRIHEKRNGIWAFIIQNSYRPSLLTGRFDVMATNPPWLSMSHIQDVPYKNQLELKAEQLNIKPPGRAFLHTDIGTVFTLHCINHFLAENGRAAFILPRTIFNGDHHHRFRIQEFTDVVPMELTEVWDFLNVDWHCDTAQKPFKTPACLVIGKKAENLGRVVDPIPARFWVELSDNIDSIRTGNIIIRRYGDKSAWLDDSIDVPAIQYHNIYPERFSQGADLFPRTGLFVDVTRATSDQNVVSIRTSIVEVQNPDNKLLKGRMFSGHANGKYLFCTATSKALLPFLVLSDRLPTVVLPVAPSGGRMAVLSNDELIDRGDIETADWFNQINRESELGQRGVQSRINVYNKLTNQAYSTYKYTVHYGAGGTHPCAAILRMERLNFPFVADQTTYAYGTNDEDEAHYLVGVLNSEALSKAIKPFQASGDFGPRHIHELVTPAIPLFDRNNPLHMEIARLSRELEQAAKNALNAQMADLTQRIQDRRSLMEERLAELKEPLDRLVEDVLR